MNVNESFFKVSASLDKPDVIERRIKELEALRAQRKAGSYLSVIDTGVLNALRIQREGLLHGKDLKANG